MSKIKVYRKKKNIFHYNAKALPEGTVRTWGGQDYKKTGGDWIKVKRGKQPEEKKPIGEKPKEKKVIDDVDAMLKWDNFLDDAKEDLNITDEDLEYDDGTLNKKIIDLADKNYSKWLEDNNIEIKGYEK